MAAIRLDAARPTTASKVQRLGWTLKDIPGEFAWLDKHSLIIDHNYQRQCSTDRAVAMARAWSWVACGVVVVARRADSDVTFVVDGQHRVAAARKRDDIQLLPCMIFESSGISEEAEGFLNANASRKTPSTFDKWKAMLEMGDATALFIDALIRSSGRVPGNSSRAGNIKCLATLCKLADTQRDILVALWPLLVKLSEGLPFSERILLGMVWIETNLVDEQSLMRPKWRDRALRLGQEALLAAANRSSAYFIAGGMKVWGQGILDAINKGCKDRLTLRNSQ